MRFIRWVLGFTALFLSVGVGVIAGIYAYYVNDLPDYTQLESRRVFQTASILDRNGTLLGEFNDPQGGRRTLVPLSDVPVALRNATIAAEDAQFYSHPGFDPRAVVRALWQNLWGQRFLSGASTITQQLVKNTLLTPEQSADRKIKEALLAIEITRRFSKDRILELYLNEVYYGNLAYGVEAAAQTYFGRPVRELDLAQITFIAGLPQSPSGYDPYVNPAEARERQDYVLAQMERHGMIDHQEAERARSTPIVLRPPRLGDQSVAPHFVFFVRDLLERSYRSDVLFREGLQVRTTLDLNVQRMAEQAAREHIQEVRARNANNAALVAIKPSTGEILAMVGSVDYEDRQIAGQVNVALANRQPGSTLKPFTYLTAFQQGWSPATMLMDVPTTFGGNYTPLNYDAKFRGPVSVRRALASSLNVPAVKTLETVGIAPVLANVRRMGINGLADPSRYGLSLTLGGGEVTLLDLTYAYVPFAAGGMQAGRALAEAERTPGSRELDPVAILEIKNSAGRVLYQQQQQRPRQVVDPRHAYVITSILSDDEARAETFGRNSALQLSRPAAAKTGSTDRFVDSWVVGYTPDLVAGVWVGNSDGSPMKDVLGATGAGRIWHTFMERALANVQPRQFERPAGVVDKEVCVPSGLLPSPECPKRATDVFLAENVPTKMDDLYRRVDVCRANGKLAFDLVPANARESRIFLALPAPNGQWAAQLGFAPPPTQRCDDVYRGVRVAEITSPVESAAVTGTVQVAGSAMMDDFHHLDLEVGVGANPESWLKLTNARTQGVDKALLGVWNTAAAASGPYTLRLTVYDGVGNTIQKLTRVTVAPAATPVPSPRPIVNPTPRGLVVPPTQTPSAPPLIGPAATAVRER